METPSGGDQVAHEDEGLARRNDVVGAPVPVGQIRGDDQLAAAADLHPLHALVFTTTPKARRSSRRYCPDARAVAGPKMKPSDATMPAGRSGFP
jgi:hypothetical protein